MSKRARSPSSVMQGPHPCCQDLSTVSRLLQDVNQSLKGLIDALNAKSENGSAKSTPHHKPGSLRVDDRVWYRTTADVRCTGVVTKVWPSWLEVKDDSGIVSRQPKAYVHRDTSAPPALAVADAVALDLEPDLTFE